MFASQFIKDNKAPVLSLEIDCRGKINVHENNKNIETWIEIGEIKSKINGNEHKATKQLIIRLQVIAKAHEIIAKEIFGAKQVTIMKKGIIFHGSKNHIEKQKCVEDILINSEYI